MSNTKLGIVQAISGKDITTKFGEKKVYDIKVDGEWFGGLWNDPKCKKGDEVSFIGIETPPYGWKIKGGSLKVVREGVGDTSEDPTDSPKTTQKQGSRTKYFGFPISPTDKQMSIIIQSSLARATDVVLASFNANTDAAKRKISSAELAEDIIKISNTFVDRASGMDLAEELLTEQKQKHEEYSKLFSGELDLPKPETSDE